MRSQVSTDHLFSCLAKVLWSSDDQKECNYFDFCRKRLLAQQLWRLLAMDGMATHSLEFKAQCYSSQQFKGIETNSKESKLLQTNGVMVS